MTVKKSAFSQRSAISGGINSILAGSIFSLSSFEHFVGYDLTPQQKHLVLTGFSFVHAAELITMIMGMDSERRLTIPMVSERP